MTDEITTGSVIVVEGHEYIVTANGRRFVGDDLVIEEGEVGAVPESTANPKEGFVNKIFEITDIEVTDRTIELEE